jgi:hypothetical protein
MDWITESLVWVATQYPVVGGGLMALGGAFVVLELFVKATPSEKDDEKLHAFFALGNGYVGRVYHAIKKFSPLKTPPAGE